MTLRVKNFCHAASLEAEDEDEDEDRRNQFRLRKSQVGNLESLETFKKLQLKLAIGNR